MERKTEKIVLYDGVCNLCDATVRFILLHDARATFRFASLQGTFARETLARSGIAVAATPESLILIDDGVVRVESEAALRIAGGLDFPWKLLGLLRAIPRPIRDAVYRWVARNRYRWFGKQETCLLPQPRWKDRFLETPAELERR